MLIDLCDSVPPVMTYEGYITVIYMYTIFRVHKPEGQN